MLQTIYLLHFCRIRINPVHLRFVGLNIRIHLAVLWAQVATQVNAPISIILSPPIEVNMKASPYRWPDETEPFSFAQCTLPNIIRIPYSDSI